NIMVKNNLFYDIDPARWGGQGYAFHLSKDGASDISYIHNTAVTAGGGLLCDDGTAVKNITIIDNILHYHVGMGADAGTKALDKLAGSTWQMRHNAIVVDSGLDYWRSAYPAENAYVESYSQIGFESGGSDDYKLSATSRLVRYATDRKAVGCDYEQLREIVKEVTKTSDGKSAQ
ncbi:MAG: hypothetical protein JOZ48_23390, partial [Acidobacteriaceae bacterium]|nr:hypothetical protein [Acidobacteriaceae bacterium]